MIFQEMLRDCTRLTESLAKTVGGDKEVKLGKCGEVMQMRLDTVPVWLAR